MRRATCYWTSAAGRCQTTQGRTILCCQLCKNAQCTDETPYGKSYEDLGETNKKTNQITQSQDSSMETGSLTLSEEDALKAQIFGCWSIPLGLPYDENLLVRIRLKLKPDGTLIKTEVLDHARMNKPGQNFYKVLAESALRAIQLCQPLKVPTSGYDKWKDLQLNFDPREMLGG